MKHEMDDDDDNDYYYYEAAKIAAYNRLMTNEI